MGKALLVMAALLAAIGLGSRLRGVWLRRRAQASLPAIERAARGVSMRILVQGTTALRGMSTQRANRTRGDLLLGGDRFLVVTNRGVLLDLARGSAVGLTSARCTGPGRLVLEGAIPTPTGAPGLYRVDVPIDDADAWAEALRPFVS